MPLDAALLLGSLVGCGVALVARRARVDVLRRLRDTPGLPTDSARLAREHFEDLGRRIAEFVNAERLLARGDWEVPSETSCLLHGLARPRCGVLVAAAHLDNWELLAAALARAGHDTHTLAATPRAGPVSRWLFESRARLGVYAHPPGGGARAARRRLDEGRPIAMLVDLATRERARTVDFLGRPTRVSETLERLAQATGAAVVFVWPERAGARVQVRAVQVEATPGEGRLTEALTALVEARILRAPEAWLWIHDRWPVIVEPGPG
jgi:KDO2-lipid IV(A) lauroyltransferase